MDEVLSSPRRNFESCCRPTPARERTLGMVIVSRGARRSRLRFKTLRGHGQHAQHRSEHGGSRPSGPVGSRSRENVVGTAIQQQRVGDPPGRKPWKPARTRRHERAANSTPAVPVGPARVINGMSAASTAVDRRHPEPRGNRERLGPDRSAIRTTRIVAVRDELRRLIAVEVRRGGSPYKRPRNPVGPGRVTGEVESS